MSQRALIGYPKSLLTAGFFTYPFSQFFFQELPLICASWTGFPTLPPPNRFVDLPIHSHPSFTSLPSPLRDKIFPTFLRLLASVFSFTFSSNAEKVATAGVPSLLTTFFEHSLGLRFGGHVFFLNFEPGLLDPDHGLTGAGLYMCLIPDYSNLPLLIIRLLLGRCIVALILIQIVSLRPLPCSLSTCLLVESRPPFF